MGEPIETAAVFVVRAAQALALSLPTVLCGMLVSGALVVWVGTARVQKYFGADGPGAIARAWGFAFFLPVCGLGVVPVLLTLRRLGASWPSVVVVALSAPLLTPWTLGYLIDRCGVTGVLLLVCAVGLTSVGAGLCVRGLKRDTTQANDSQEPVASSSLLTMLVASGRAIDRVAILWIALALLGVGLVAVCIPPNWIGDALVERSATHAVLLSVVAVLSYVPPWMTALQAGEVVNESTMPGLVVTLVGLGAAVNVGLCVVGAVALGWRRALRVGVVVTTIALGTGLLVDRLLFDPTYQPEDTHAFEDVGRPFHLLDHVDGPLAGAWFRFTRATDASQGYAGVAVVLLMLAGTVWRGRTPGALLGGADLVWSGRVLRAACVIGVAGTVVASVYAYYPSPRVLGAELRATSAEFWTSHRRGEHQNALRLARQLDRRLSQLPTASWVHGQSISPRDVALIETLREQLHLELRKTDVAPDSGMQLQRDMIALLGRID